MEHLIAYLGVAALVIMTPGQDTALTIRNTLAGGRRAGVFTAIGVCSGQMVWVTAAAVGLTALLVASEPAFLALRYAGAAYLVWLGVQSLVHAVRGQSTPSGGERATMEPRAALRQGVVSDLGNPKIAVFFTSLLPQFAPAHGAFPVYMGLGALFALMTFAWLAAYAYAIARARRALERPRVRRTLDAVTGTVLVGLGLRLAAESR